MDHAGVKAALARVMSRHTALPLLIHESQEKIVKETLVDKIEAKAESLGVATATVAKDLLLSHLRSLAKGETKKHNNSSEPEELVDIMEYLVAKKVLAGTELEQSLLQEPLFFRLPLPAIWRMSQARIVSLELVIKRIYDNNHGNSTFLVKKLLNLLLHQRGQTSTQAASDILALLVGLMYSASASVGQEWQPLAKYAGEVLKCLTEGVLDVVTEHSFNGEPPAKKQRVEGIDEKLPEKTCYNERTQSYKQEQAAQDKSEDVCEVMNMYHLILENPRVPPESLERYFSAQLVQVLTHRPNIKLTKVLRRQEVWCSAKANPTLLALLQKLVVGLGHEESLNTLELVLGNEEVNWGCVLTLVATALTCHHATATKLKELIERNIRRGCEELEMEPLVVGFLFARHAGQEGPHLFPSYTHWFSSLFINQHSSPAAQKQSFVFLMRFLEDMVPHEPAYCLRAHLTAHMYTPKGCQEVLQSYTHLARARLQDLNEALQDNTHKLSPKAKVVEEVESAVKQFSETAKIPSFILEASIFRETYFRASFLPALLTPRHLPEVPDARAKLIEALHARGKITAATLKTYTEACEKEASDLLQGVFMDVEEDLVIEEPITELSHLLEDLITTHHSHQASDSSVQASKLLPLLSRTALKIEEMMKSSDAQLKDAKHVVVDPRLYDEKRLSSQIVEQIYATLEKLLLPPDTEGEEGKEGSEETVRPGWLSQLLSLLSCSATLQGALSLLLHHHTALTHTTQGQLRMDGILLCEVNKIEGLFLPVLCASQPWGELRPPTAHYLHTLPLDTPQDLHRAGCILSSWLAWHVVCEGAASLPAPPLHLYLCLAPRLPLLLNHQEGSEATAADVYNYLAGCGVPECSRLYFSDHLKDMDCQIPLKTWVQFELKASWGTVPVEVRQTYLYSVLLQKVTPTHHCSSEGSQQPPHKRPPHLVYPLVFVLIDTGLVPRNASELLMLVQTAGQLAGEPGVCLLEAWHTRYKAGLIDGRQTLAFMSICRCVSPSLFLRAEKLLELAEILQSFISVLQSVTEGLQLSLCDASFLCAALLTAAKNPLVRNLQVELCLRPIKAALVFHWDSLRNFFRSHQGTVEKHEFLNCLCEILDMDIANQIQLLGSELGGIRLLSMRLDQTACNTNSYDIESFPGKTLYVKWLLAYLGLQQVKGDVPYLVREGEELEMTQFNRNVVFWSYQELSKLLGSKSISEVSADILPAERETNLGLRLVPVACIFMVMCAKDAINSSNMCAKEARSSNMCAKEANSSSQMCAKEANSSSQLLAKEGSSSNMYAKQASSSNMFVKEANSSNISMKQISSNVLGTNFIDITLQCHNLICQTFDTQSDDSNRSSGSSVSKNIISKRWTPDLDYLSHLHQSILSYLSVCSPSSLGKITKGTLVKCDAEIRAAIYIRLASKKKC